MILGQATQQVDSLGRWLGVIGCFTGLVGAVTGIMALRLDHKRAKREEEKEKASSIPSLNVKADDHSNDGGQWRVRFDVYNDGAKLVNLDKWIADYSTDGENGTTAVGQVADGQNGAKTSVLEVGHNVIFIVNIRRDNVTPDQLRAIGVTDKAGRLYTMPQERFEMLKNNLKRSR